MNKKAQVTLFVIVGILIVVFVMMYFLLLSREVKCEHCLKKLYINIQSMKTECFDMPTEGEKKKALLNTYIQYKIYSSKRDFLPTFSK